MLYPGMCTNLLTALWLQSSKTLKRMNSPNNKGLKDCPYIKVNCNVGTSLSLAFIKACKTQRRKSMLPPLGIASREWGHSSHLQGQLRKTYLQNAYVFVYIDFKYTYIGGITLFSKPKRKKKCCFLVAIEKGYLAVKKLPNFLLVRQFAILWKQNMLLCFP